jgi:hypothetical protein
MKLPDQGSGPQNKFERCPNLENVRGKIERIIHHRSRRGNCQQKAGEIDEIFNKTKTLGAILGPTHLS